MAKAVLEGLMRHAWDDKGTHRDGGGDMSLVGNFYIVSKTTLSEHRVNVDTTL